MSKWRRSASQDTAGLRFEISVRRPKTLAATAGCCLQTTCCQASISTNPASKKRDGCVRSNPHVAQPNFTALHYLVAARSEKCSRCPSTHPSMSAVLDPGKSGSDCVVDVVYAVVLMAAYWNGVLLVVRPRVCKVLHALLSTSK